MNDDINKNKLRIQDIINEITNIKKYNSELHDNCKGQKLDDYLNKLDNDIIKTKNKVEDLYTKTFQ